MFAAYRTTSWTLTKITSKSLDFAQTYTLIDLEFLHQINTTPRVKEYKTILMKNGPCSKLPTVHNFHPGKLKNLYIFFQKQIQSISFFLIYYHNPHSQYQIHLYPQCGSDSNRIEGAPKRALYRMGVELDYIFQLEFPIIFGTFSTKYYFPKCTLPLCR